jgi:hypothetical protein
MKLFFLLLIIPMVACANRASQCNIGVEMRKYAEALMYYYENPTVDNLARINDYRKMVNLEKEKSLYGDSSSWDHFTRTETTFYSLVFDRFGFLVNDKVNKNITADFIKSLKVNYSGDLDVYWTAFFATGDMVFFNLVYNNINHSDPLISGAAKWSVMANYKQHPRIKVAVDSDLDKYSYVKMTKKGNVTESVSPVR